MSETAPQTKSRLQAVRAAIESGRLRPIKRMLLSLQPAETALLLDSLPPAERELLWEAVDPDDEGEVLLHVAEEVRTGLIRGMDDEELVAAAGELEVDDLADLIGDLPETVTQQVLRSLDELDRGRLQRVLTYPEDTAGGLMNTDAVTVRPEVTLKDHRKQRSKREERDTRGVFDPFLDESIQDSRDNEQSHPNDHSLPDLSPNGPAPLRRCSGNARYDGK